MTQMADRGEFTTVRAAEDMPREDFCRHMDMRHSESLGGLTGVPLFMSDYVERCWRAFHTQLHRLRLQEHIDHDHGPSRRRPR